MNIVERIYEYCQNIVPEAPELQPGDPNITSWPTSGTIEFKNVEIRYESRPDHPVIKNLSFSVNAGEKIGVVGRTGSGKSTLVTSLYRFLELSDVKIIVGDQDKRPCGQDPILFKGSYRSNLDPYLVFSDSDIWESLECVGMKDYISEQSSQLDAPVTQMGENLSVGQRQLLCLARSILTKPKILIMDEATSSIDSKSNELLQTAIQTLFAHTTVLSIAHRLLSIVTYDRVLVLQDGAILEYDSPQSLLENPESAFYGMALASGCADILLEMAKSEFS
jgi:ABC-type multidrug transport system fused ATPase/permease subunit